MSKDLTSFVVGIKNTRVSEDGDGKGRDKVTYTLDKEQATALLEAVSAVLEKDDSRVFVEIRSEMKTSEAGREFPSSFMIIREALPKPETRAKTPPASQHAAARTAKIAKSIRG